VQPFTRRHWNTSHGRRSSRLYNGSRKVKARIFLDSGATDNFVTKNLCWKLGTSRPKQPRQFTVAGGRTIKRRGEVTFSIQSALETTKLITVTCCILEHITSDLPHESFKINDWDHLAELNLADPKFYKPQPVDILLGASTFDQLLKSQ